MNTSESGSVAMSIIQLPSIPIDLASSQNNAVHILDARYIQKSNINNYHLHYVFAASAQPLPISLLATSAIAATKTNTCAAPQHYSTTQRNRPPQAHSATLSHGSPAMCASDRSL